MPFIRNGEWNPTEAEIRTGCLAIQATWSQHEERVRRLCPHLEDIDAIMGAQGVMFPTTAVILG